MKKKYLFLSFINIYNNYKKYRENIIFIKLILILDYFINNKNNTI